MMMRKTTLAATLATLLATSKADGIVDYKNFEMDAPVEDIMWCGTGDEVILVQTQFGTIYRSRDRGASWKKMQDVFDSKGYRVSDNK